MIVDEFIEYIKVEKRYSPRTVELYSNALAGFYGFVLEGERVSSGGDDAAGELEAAEDDVLAQALTPVNIRCWIAMRMQGGVGARTMNLHLSAMSSYCRYLVRRGLLAENPVEQVYRPKEEHRLPEFYTQKALEDYMDIRESDFEGEETYSHLRSRMIVTVLYATGMRRAELCSLKISNFDSSRKVFRIVGKGNKMREIPVPDRICQLISLYLNRIKNEFPDNAEGYFFLTDKGRPLYLAFVDRVVKKELTGIDGFTGRKSPHVLRHSLATHLLNGGSDLNSIKELLGHSSLAATQVYTHNSFEQMKNTYLTAHPRAKKRR